MTHRPTIIVILETRRVSVKLKKAFEKLGFEDFIYTDNYGFARGIKIGWKEEDVSVSLAHKEFQFIQVWNFTTVCASPNAENRKLLWEKLKDISETNQVPWLNITGDFNDIVYDHEKRGGVPLS
ncbi:unnamed protein product [Lathyrus sativus]|nr:unnamed protein product [Lathyrus sativus]